MEENKTEITAEPRPGSERHRQSPQHRPKPARPYEHWKRRAYIVWTLIGAGVVFMAALAVAGIIWQAVAVMIVAGLVTFLFHGAVDFFERKRIPRMAGTAICIAGVFVLMALALLAFIPNIVIETQNFVANVPAYASQARELVAEISSSGIWEVDSSQVTQMIDSISKWAAQQASGIVSGAASGILGGVMDFSTGVMIFFIAMLCAFWLLADWPKISAEIRKIVPESRHDDLDILKEAFGTAVYGWLKATIVCALLTGIASFVVFTVLGMPYAVVLAILCAIMYVIPYIGIVVACLMAGLVGLLVSPVTAVLALVLVAVVTNVIANLVSPRLMESSLSLHPALVLIVIMIGGGLAGIWGMLLSIPLAAALQAVFVTYFEARTGRELASEDGAFFRSAARLTSAESLVIEEGGGEDDEGADD